MKMTTGMHMQVMLQFDTQQRNIPFVFSVNLFGCQLQVVPIPETCSSGASQSFRVGAG